METLCLDEQTLLDFLAGRLAGEATSRARAHVAQCEICNAIATELIQGAAANVVASPSAENPTTKGYELAAGAVVAEKYRLVRPLGDGGMGVVWEAEPLEKRSSSEPNVAIKLLKAFDAAAKKRFLREIAITSRLTHPGLVRVVDVLEDVEAGCPALVMELLSGMSLAARLVYSKKIAAPAEARSIACAIATTLAAVHDAGLVHRDVKPANIHLLAGDDDVPPARSVVLLDLGLAKAFVGDETMTTRLTRTGHAVGTPAYMAPEQLAGETSIDARADLWSLGVVLYECLTGKRPFAGRTIAEILRATAEGPPLSMEEIDDPGTAAILRSLLEPDPSARPASARAAFDALAKIDPER